MNKDQIIVSVCVIILLMATALSTILHEDDSDDGDEESSNAMLDATRAYLGSGKSTMITAEALYANLNDGYTGNDPFILSIRGASDYAKGHIPGAVNIGFRSVFTEENLSKLPMNKQIVVYCYTGHTASQITALLNVYGYDAMCLKWGMVSWTSDTDIAPGFYDRSTVPNYPVYIGDQPGNLGGATTVLADVRQCGGDEPAPTTTEEVDTDGVDLASQIQAYLSSGKAPAISAAALYDNINDGDQSNDPFILSIRSASQYAKGHIPGAEHIGFTSLFTDENMSKLPDDDQQIVVVCYTGHTASQATALLNVNGFNATALKFGMTSWTTNGTVAPSYYNRAMDAHNYPVSVGETQGTIDTAVIADTEDVILDATNAFLGAGKSTMITAEALYNNLNDNYASNDPFILSIRGATHYDLGHIPGAVNIPFREVFTEENIAKLPTEKQIVVYCYTGHTASQITAMLNVIGYDAVCLKWGMCSWTTNTSIATSCYDKELNAFDYPVVPGSDPGTWVQTRGEDPEGPDDKQIDDVLPTTRQGCGDDPGGSGGTETTVGASQFDILRPAFNNYLAAGKPAAVPADSLYANLNDGDATNDPFLLSIRSGTQYAIGHIPGAVNIAFGELFTGENMAKLPDDDQQIVVVCYTGHTASQAAALLNVNGFNATALKWAMTSWSSNATIAPSAYNRGKDCHNYPVSVGAEPGSIATAVIKGKTDQEIIMDASRAYLEGGTKFITAETLDANLDDGNETNNPFILSIRSSTHYELGHIPGAVNIPWRSLFTLENLSKLPGDDTQVVVVCYTGQSASQVTALLNVLGFNATTLKHGMCSWSTSPTVSPSCFDPATHQMDYPIEINTRGTPDASGTRDCGDDGGGSGGIFEGSADEWEILRQATERYANEVSAMTITSTALNNNLFDGYTTNDPFVLSLRAESDFNNGHIPGAVRISAGSLLDEDNLAQLPMDKQILVYCYTGQGAGHVSALLNINGYDAISLKYGMCSWNSTAASKCYSPDHDNYRVSTGPEPGIWAEAVPAS